MHNQGNIDAWRGIPTADQMRRGSRWPDPVTSLPDQRHPVRPADIDLTESAVGVVDVNIEPQVIT